MVDGFIELQNRVEEAIVVANGNCYQWTLFFVCGIMVFVLNKKEKEIREGEK